MTEEKQLKYRVKPGFRHGKNKQHGSGAIVEMTEFEASGFLDKLELVGEATPAEETPAPVAHTDAAIKLAAEADIDLADVMAWADKERLGKPDVEAYIKAQEGEKDE